MEPAVVVRIHPGQFYCVAPRARPPSRVARLLRQEPRLCRRAILFGALFLLAFPPSAWGQKPTDPPWSTQVHRDDSLALLTRAKEAQRRFEDTHRRHLPVSREKTPGECEEYIGSICLWTSDFGWTHRVEDSSLVLARGELMRVLETTGGALPGDRWILGQRIRYLGDVGRWQEALVLAVGCPETDGWWCHGLLGYVLHRSGRVVEALRAFSLSLEALGPEEGRVWGDPSPILDSEERSWLKDPPGMSPARAAYRFWTLADPLFLTPGNEGLSEYYARRFAITLYEDTALTMGFRWSRGYEELLLRYGFVAGWERAPPGFTDQGGRGVFQHRHPEARKLFPPYEALEDPSGLPEDVWTSGVDPPRNTNAPILAPLVADGTAQTAVLRRGENLLVVGAYGIPQDTSFQRRRPGPDSLPGSGGTPGDSAGSSRPPWEPPVEGLSSDTLAGLFLVADTGAWAPHATLGSGGKGVLQLQVPPGGYLLSLEQWSPQGRWGARVRHGVRGESIPPDVPHLSDLLLMNPAEDLPDTFEESVDRIRSSVTLEPRGRVTVGWEVYGLSRRREPLTFHLSLVSEGGSLIRRAIERIGLFRKDPVLTLSWTEDGPSELGPYFRSLDIDLPDLEEGRYLLRLELRMPFRSPVVSNRRITVF